MSYSRFEFRQSIKKLVKLFNWFGLSKNVLWTFIFAIYLVSLRLWWLIFLKYVLFPGCQPYIEGSVDFTELIKKLVKVYNWLGLSKNVLWIFYICDIISLPPITMVDILEERALRGCQPHIEGLSLDGRSKSWLNCRIDLD